MRRRRTALVAIVAWLLLLAGCSQDGELVEPLLFGDDADSLAVSASGSVDELSCPTNATE